ncbi:MAG: Holliday junction branch migration protein RuvA [Chlamydiota bacterium]
MIEFVKGTLFNAEPTAAIIDVKGMGYKVFITTGDYAQLPQEGQEILLYTSFILRENLQALYGFLDVKERNLFEMLLSVSGIGPKTAMALISNLNLSMLQEAVQQGDTSAIAKVPGIGKKTAERLLIDVRDKFAHSPQTKHNLPELKTGSSAISQTVQDAMAALINLGYNQKTAEKAIKKTLADCDQEPPLATLITKSLRYI